MRDGGEGDEESAVMIGGEGSCVSSGGVTEKDCFKLPVVTESSRKNSHIFPFLIEFFFNKVHLEKLKVLEVVKLFVDQDRRRYLEEMCMSNYSCIFVDINFEDHLKILSDYGRFLKE